MKPNPSLTQVPRRSFLSSSLIASAALGAGSFGAGAFGPKRAAAVDEAPRKRARIAITFDLEMSRKYPMRDNLEWDYQKGNLNEETKKYSLDAARLAKRLGVPIHFFCVGRVLEQASVDWLKQIAALGHPIGNHTYDHVNVWATQPEQTQFRFQRSPWLIGDKTTAQIIRENVRITTLAMKQRIGIDADGFRTPGGSSAALDGRPDLQQLLLDEGFRWVSSKYPRHKSSRPGSEPTSDVFPSIVAALKHAQPYVYPSGLVEIPMSPISDVGAFRTSRWSLGNFLRSIEQCIEWAIAEGGVFDFLCHPSIMYVEDPKFKVVQRIRELVAKAGDRAEIVGLSAIAEPLLAKNAKGQRGS